jgi:hypothetical protein
MWLRLVAAMVPSVCVLALVAYDYSEMSLGHSTSIHDSHADVAHIVDDHAEGGDHTVISALAPGQVRRSRCRTTNMCLEARAVPDRRSAIQAHRCGWVWSSINLGSQQGRCSDHLWKGGYGALCP